MNLPKELVDLSDVLASLPGVGYRLSQRMALYLATSGKDNANVLKSVLSDSLSKISSCKVCFNITTQDTCDICDSESRNRDTIWVLEDSLDLIAIEDTGKYSGVYHVLQGLIVPMEGIGPDDLTIKQLIDRVEKGIQEKKLKEIVFGLNPTVEGDSTALFIKNEMSKFCKKEQIKLSQLAKGIPAGGDLGYVSGQTIIDSYNSRVDL